MAMASAGLSPQALAQDRAPEIYAAHITIYCLAVVAVTLRLITRRILRSSLWWDDYFILVSLVCATGLFAIFLIWLSHGVGKHLQVAIVAHPDAPEVYLKGTLGAEFVYTLSICFTKLSILAFYWRIFAVTSIRKPIYVLAAITIAWTVAVIVTSGLTCIPINALWNLTMKGKCINLAKFYIGNTVPNVLTDVAFLCLPLPYVWKLQISASQKVLVLGAFIFGGFTCVVSIIRLAIISHLTLVDLTWDSVDLVLWTGIETWCAIICASLPSLRPLLRIVRGRPLTKNSQSTRKNSKPSINTQPVWSGHNKRSRSLQTNASDFFPLRDDVPDQRDQWGVAPVSLTRAYSEAAPSKADSSSAVELNRLGNDGIKVQTNITWNAESPSP